MGRFIDQANRLLAALLMTALTIGYSSSDIALPDAQVQWAPGLLGGTLADMARQAGVAIQLPSSAATLQRHQEKGAGKFSEAFPAMMRKYLPGWTWRFDGSTITLQRTPAGAAPPAQTPPTRREQGSPAGASAEKPTYLLLTGDEVVAQGELPHFTPAMVVDGSVTVLPDNVIELKLSPLGPVCLVGRQDTACLRVLNPNDRGEVSIQLDGARYKVRYTVDTEALVLYRYSLKTADQKSPAIDTARVNPYPRSTPDTARVNPYPRSTPPPPPAAQSTAPAVPSAPVAKQLNNLSNGPWLYSSRGLYEWKGLKFNKTNSKDMWWQIGAYRSTSILLEQIARLDKNRVAPIAVYQRSNGVLVLLVGASQNLAAMVRKLGFTPIPFRQ